MSTSSPSRWPSTASTPPPSHGDLDQSLRTATLDNFRAGELKILVASDVAARGLDVPSVSHIFNFDVPIHADDYVHRIGRTGRAGRSGAAFMLATPRDGKYVDFIEKLTGIKLARRAMTDMEVREDRGPRRDEKRGQRDRGRHGRDRKPPGGKFHDQVAATEPSREAPVQQVPAAANAPRQNHGQHHHKPHAPKKPQDRAPEKAPVDRNQLPAFLFRKASLPKREPQD